MNAVAGNTLTLEQLKADYTRAVKIVHAEKAMRERVFAQKPAQLVSKVQEMNDLERILTTWKDALKTGLAATQPALFDGEPTP